MSAVGAKNLKIRGLGCASKGSKITGESLLTEHQGWDPKYCRSKLYRARKGIAYRMAEMADGHPKKMMTAEKDTFCQLE